MSIRQSHFWSQHAVILAAHPGPRQCAPVWGLLGLNGLLLSEWGLEEPRGQCWRVLCAPLCSHCWIHTCQDPLASLLTDAGNVGLSPLKCWRAQGQWSWRGWAPRYLIGCDPCLHTETERLPPLQRPVLRHSRHPTSTQDNVYFFGLCKKRQIWVVMV